jgi:hypothetical protein
MASITTTSITSGILLRKESTALSILSLYKKNKKAYKTEKSIQGKTHRINISKFTAADIECGSMR